MVAVICTAAATIPAARLSQRVGRKVVIYAAAAISALGMTIAALAPAPPVLAVGAILVGIGGGSFLAVDWALLTDIIPKASAGRYMGISNIATATNGVAAAFVGGLVIDAFSRFGSPELGPRVAFLLGPVWLALGVLLLRPVDERRREGDGPPAGPRRSRRSRPRGPRPPDRGGDHDTSLRVCQAASSASVGVLDTPGVPHIPVVNKRTTAKSQTAARMAARSSARSQAAGRSQPTSTANPAAPAITSAERSIDHGVAVVVGERPGHEGEGDQQERDRAGEQPGRGRRGLRLVRVLDEADHRGPGPDDRDGDRQVRRPSTG